MSSSSARLTRLGKDAIFIPLKTDAYAEQALSPLIREIHKRVIEVKENKEMEVEYMTLLQRDRENIELGREEGLELGREEGSENMAALIKVLIAENRIEDLRRASEDTGFRDKLLREYHIL